MILQSKVERKPCACVGGELFRQQKETALRPAMGLCPEHVRVVTGLGQSGQSSVGEGGT